MKEENFSKASQNRESIVHLGDHSQPDGNLRENDMRQG